MDFVGFLKDGFFGSLSSVFNMAIIIIPLMVIMEVLRDSKILEKISKILKPISNFFDVSEEAMFPLVIGLIFGLAYGAGVIIDAVQEKDLSKKDLYIVIIFLVACHSVLEDTLVLMAIGASGTLLLIIRVLSAIIVTFITSKVLNTKEVNSLNIKK